MKIALEEAKIAFSAGDVPVDQAQRAAKQVDASGDERRTNPVVVEDQRFVDNRADVLSWESAPLETDLMLGFLAPSYPLRADLGDRFATLGGLPRRIDIGGPRYLYRYRAPARATAPHARPPAARVAH